MNTKTLTILTIAAAGAVVIAAVALRSDRSSGSAAPIADAAGKTGGLFTDLAGKLNDVSLVSVKTAGAESNVELVDGQWRLKEKSGYPVDAGKVRGVLLALTSLRNFEPKTNRPELYKTLGVEDVAAPPAPDAAGDTAPTGPGSLLITVKDKAGQAITSVIVGNTKWGGGMGGGSQGIYLRKTGDTQSYYAEGKVDLPREQLTWVNNEFADISRDRVRSVVLTPVESPETNTITVVKEKPAEGSFAVQGVPTGKQLKDASLPETLVAGLVKASFEDVAKAETIDFAGTAGGKPGASAVVRTWDGLLVTVTATESGGRTWWKLVAAADPDPFKEGEGDAAKPKRTPEEVKKEVDELNARFAGWAFSPYSYKSIAFNKKFSDELKDPAPPTPASPGHVPGDASAPPGASFSPSTPMSIPVPPLMPQSPPPAEPPPTVEPTKP